jgi:class 3 adenylate cyclase
LSTDDGTVGLEPPGGDEDHMGRLGVRVLALEEMRRLGRIGALLYLVSGLSVVQIWATARDDVAQPTPYLVSGVAAAAVAVGVLVMLSTASDAFTARVYPEVAIALLFGAALAVPVILYFAGFASFAVGASVYVLPLILGGFVLRRRLAALLFASVAVGHAVLLAVSDDVVAPPSQYLFLLAVLAASSVLVGGLVDRLDRTARREQRAVEALATANEQLSVTVSDQVDELERLARLRRFLAPQVADGILSSGNEAFLAAHRREIAVFFCDLRGFTAFAAEVEPEEVMEVLQEYYREAGEQLHKFEATVGAFAGDGIMAYFNDPNPCDRPASEAVAMAMALRRSLAALQADWSRRGYMLGCGMGIAMGHATLGVVGFEGRSDYTPLGTVVNRASRLCDEATAGQILVDRRVGLLVEPDIELTALPDLTLKGFAAPVPCFEVVAGREPSD